MFTRRTIFGAGVAAWALAQAVFAAEQSRALRFNNLHTGETLEVVYWTDGGYCGDAL